MEEKIIRPLGPKARARGGRRQRPGGGRDGDRGPLFGADAAVKGTQGTLATIDGLGGHAKGEVSATLDSLCATTQDLSA